MTSQPTQPPKPSRGCFFYGCIAGIVCLVAILVAFLLGVHMFKKVLNQYTDTKPAALPALTMPAAQVEAVQRRVNAFQEALSTGAAVPPLELSSDDLNAIIGAGADFQALKDKVYLRVEGDKLNAQVSVPMAQIGLPMFRGRYLNGQATFAITILDGRLIVSPSAISVKDKALPEVYMQKLRSENLAAAVNQNSNASVVLSHLEKIEVKDGKLSFVPKPEK